MKEDSELSVTDNLKTGFSSSYPPVLSSKKTQNMSKEMQLNLEIIISTQKSSPIALINELKENVIL